MQFIQDRFPNMSMYWLIYSDLNETLHHQQRCVEESALTAGKAKKDTPIRAKVPASSLPAQVFGVLSP